MKDEGDRILDELLARDGAVSRAALRREAIEQMRLCCENPNTPAGRIFLRDTMIVIAAADDAEADALLARAYGSPPVAPVSPAELPDEAKRKAVEAIEGFAQAVSRKRRGGRSLH